jgi:hypothetical protein
VFEEGEEVAKKEYIQSALKDMVYFSESCRRIEEMQQFARAILGFLEAKGSGSPELKPCVETPARIAQQITEEYTVQKENMKSLEYASDLTRQTLALTKKKDSNNLKSYLELLKSWRAMGGAQDYVLAQCHTITRKLCQEAGYACAVQPMTVELAREVRARCRQVLRNPDGYEIWANY